MKLIIVYDNDVYKKDLGLTSDWGFACLIQTKRDTLLFDTGANGNILLSNMKKLNINPSNIKKIILSHEHKDHTGGLISLEPYVQDISIYHLGHKIVSKKIKSITPDKPKKLCDDVWTTGRIKGLVSEQSLVLNSNNGAYVVTGCSHPGIKKILDIAAKIEPVNGIIGGFHGFNKFSVLNHLDLICPCHCTKYKKKLKKLYPTKYIEGGVGKVLDI
jgi:7,8-dihydropterin-6-yl-methyl-4-(beta-D-ribofuranosyl)aminobenzene 5'-phosphate synthase